MVNRKTLPEKRRQHCPKLKLFNGFYSLYWMSRIVANRAETVL